MQGKSSTELLVHFNCGACQKWWSVGDAPPDKKNWFCPWCGTEQKIQIITHPPTPRET